MGDDVDGTNVGGPTEPKDAAAGHTVLPVAPMVGQVVKKTSRFSREVVATMISLASAAFGVVAALAWNTAITKGFERWFGPESASTVSLLFVYAVVVTLIGVVVIVTLGRLAARINAQPVEFKFPGMPKS